MPVASDSSKPSAIACYGCQKEGSLSLRKGREEKQRLRRNAGMGWASKHSLNMRQKRRRKEKREQMRKRNAAYAQI